MVHKSKTLTYYDILETWNSEQENRKALFTDFLYQRSGRTNGLFTGLWEEWCRESGEKLLDKDFEKTEK